MRNESGAALLAHLQGNADLARLVKTFKPLNALEHWKNVPHHDKPCVIIVDTSADPKGGWGKPDVWHLDYKLYLYTQANAADGSAQTQRNTIIDAIASALEDEPALHRQTLGRKVVACRISGIVDTDEGATGAHGVAWFPITIRPTA